MAIEFGLRHGDIRETRRHAQALRDYTEDEPLAWSSLVIARAEFLADRAEHPERADLAARRDGAASRHPRRRLPLAPLRRVKV